MKEAIRILREEREWSIQAIEKAIKEKEGLTQKQRKLTQHIHGLKAEIRSIEELLTKMGVEFLEVEINVQRVYRHRIDCLPEQLAAA